MIDALPHLVWAGAVGSVAYCGHRVAVSWLNIRERANVAAVQRAEREADMASLRAKVDALDAAWRLFQSNNARR